MAPPFSEHSKKYDYFSALSSQNLPSGFCLKYRPVGQRRCCKTLVYSPCKFIRRTSSLRVIKLRISSSVNADSIRSERIITFRPSQTVLSLNFQTSTFIHLKAKQTSENCNSNFAQSTDHLFLRANRPRSAYKKQHLPYGSTKRQM